MGGVNTRVEGDPGSLRDTASKANRLADRLHTESGDVHRAAGESESAWHGQAADKGRSFLQDTGKTIDEIVDAARKVAGAHDGLAADLDGVIRRVTQAREVARTAGLTVTGAEILPPGPAPGPGPGAAPAAPRGRVPAAMAKQHSDAMAAHGQAVAEHEAAMADHQAKQRAFEEASQTVDQARTDERHAHHRFREALREPSNLLDIVKAGAVFTGLGVMRTMWSSPNANVSKYGDLAQKHGKTASVAKQIANNPNMSPERRIVARMKYLEHENPAIKNTTNHLSSYNLDRRLPGGNALKAGLAKAPGENLAKSGSNSLLRGVGKVGKAFPFSNIVLTGVSTGVSIAGGTPADKAAASNVGGAIASTGTFVGAEAGLVALGVAGGPATLAALGVGVAVSTGVSWFVDNHWGDVKNAASDAWDSVF